MVHKFTRSVVGKPANNLGLLGALVATLAAASVPNAACAQAAPGRSAEVFVAPPTIFLRGYITPNSVKSVEAEASKYSGITTLKVTSGGGDVNSAIDLTEFVRSHKIAVLVENYCMSACGHVLFAGSLRHSVGDGAIVGFHHTEAVFALMRRERGRSEPPADDENLARLRDAYHRWGLNPEFLTAPFAILGLQCFTVVQGAASQIEYRTSSLYWVPSATQLKFYGIKTPGGAWPKMISEAMPGLVALGRDHPETTGGKVRFGGTPPSLTSVVRLSPDCDKFIGKN